MKTATASQLRQLANKFKHLNFNTSMSPERTEAFSVHTDSLYLNYARNPINHQVIERLIVLASEKQLGENIDALFAGERINRSENRAVKHWLLRAPKDPSDPDSVAVHNTLDKMQSLTQQVTEQTLLAKPVTDIICVGIGGSELGTRVVYEALTLGRKKPIRVHFVANIDGIAVADAISNCVPESSLFLMISKTFTTFETSTNFATIKHWFCAQEGLDEKQFWQQSCAITANTTAALNAGVPESHIFAFWDWVGGRYSVWSAVGLPIALACGMDAFRQLLAGAQAMDEHFKTAPMGQNLPVMLGLLHVWYSNYLDYSTRCVVTYAQNLNAFPDYLQQLEMESLGKSVDQNGQQLDFTTCPVVWGAVGSNAQHAFFQLLHQGTVTVPIDFIAAVEPCDAISDELKPSIQAHHTALLANCLAQSESLMNGGHTREDGHGDFSGNRPSNLLLLDKITPYSLGQLMAAYEHKTFVQSVIWGVNAFDQFGVELGKQMCHKILAESDNHFSLKTIKQTFNR